MIPANGEKVKGKPIKFMSLQFGLELHAEVYLIQVICIIVSLKYRQYTKYCLLDYQL